jgi:predicted component of type VI protein secretion system
MGQEYLKLPLSLVKGSFSKISLRESIYQFIGLIIGSRMGSFPYDLAFGCHIWDGEYTYLTARSKGDIRSEIRQAISSYETRLADVSVDVKKSVVDPRKNRVCLVATVKGKFTEDGEKKSFSEDYFLWQPRREGLI